MDVERCSPTCKVGSTDHVGRFNQPDRRVKSACVCFLVSRSRSDKSTPQKLFCGSKDSTPACSSFGASCRIHAIRNFAFFDPRRKLMIIPGCNCVRRAPSRAPVSVMSTVCARWVASSIVTLTGRTIFLRGNLRFSSIVKLLSCATQSRKSYKSHHRTCCNCRQLFADLSGWKQHLPISLGFACVPFRDR